MRGATANGKHASLQADAPHLGNVAQRDQLGGACQTLLQRRDQGLTTAQRLGLVIPQSCHRIGDAGGFFDIEIIHSAFPSQRSVQAVPPDPLIELSNAPGAVAPRPSYSFIADQTRDGLRGMSTWVMSLPMERRASTTALTTAGGEPIAPASPQPFTPRGLWVQGV